MSAIIKVCVICALTLTTCKGDFFSNLGNLDVDSQLQEIDKMLEKIDADEDEAIDKLLDRQADKVVDGAGDLFANFFNTDCHYKCPDGSKPKPRKTHTPSSNGCGSFGLTFEMDELPEMTECCNEHDFCYDTCGSDREICDDVFKTCLDKMCKKLKKGLSKKEYKGCKDMSKLMYTGTMALGCKPYLDGQKEACVCAKEETNASSRKPEVKHNSKPKQSGNEKNKPSSSKKENKNSKTPKKQRKDEL